MASPLAGIREQLEAEHARKLRAVEAAEEWVSLYLEFDEKLNDKLVEIVDDLGDDRALLREVGRVIVQRFPNEAERLSGVGIPVNGSGSAPTSTGTRARRTQEEIEADREKVRKRIQKLLKDGDPFTRSDVGDDVKDGDWNTVKDEFLESNKMVQEGERANATYSPA